MRSGYLLALVYCVTGFEWQGGCYPDLTPNGNEHSMNAEPNLSFLRLPRRKIGFPCKCYRNGHYPSCLNGRHVLPMYVCMYVFMYVRTRMFVCTCMYMLVKTVISSRMIGL